MVRNGFILVEWMIQFLLCTLISMIGFALFHTWSTQLTLLHRKLNTTLQVPSAFDVLRRDLLAISSDMLVVDHNRLSIARQDQHIFWQYKNGTLFRLQKKYSVAQEKWRKGIKNVAAEKLDSCLFVPIYTASVNGIMGIKLQCSNPVSLHIMCLRNGKEL